MDADFFKRIDKSMRRGMNTNSTWQLEQYFASSRKMWHSS